MNSILKTLAITFATLSLVSCSDSDNGNGGGGTGPVPGISRADIMGQWKLQEWTPGPDMKNNVYLELNDNNTFTLYGENFDEMGYKKASGKFTYNEADNLIKGTYSDDKKWGNDYNIMYMSDDKNIMKWQTLKDPNDISVYVRTTIPDEVKNTTRGAQESEEMRIL